MKPLPTICPHKECNHFDEYCHEKPYCILKGVFVQVCADDADKDCPDYCIFGMTRDEYDRECRRMSNEINDPVL